MSKRGSRKQRSKATPSRRRDAEVEAAWPPWFERHGFRLFKLGQLAYEALRAAGALAPAIVAAAAEGAVATRLHGLLTLAAGLVASFVSRWLRGRALASGSELRVRSTMRLAQAADLLAPSAVAALLLAQAAYAWLAAVALATALGLGVRRLLRRDTE